MTEEKSQMMDEGSPTFKGNKSAFSKARILLIIFAIIAVIILIVGIVLIALAGKKKDCKGEENGNNGSTEEQVSSSFCEYSEEAKRIGLDDIILRAKNAYYEKLPFKLPDDPDAKREDIKEKYSAYNPTPDYVRSVTDAAWDLFKQVNETEMDSNKLKPRERKAISQLKHYLKTVFGQPFDMNFYAGDWMMGPTFYCKQPICNIGSDLKAMLGSLKPENLKDVELIESKMKVHKEGILRYMENLKMGKLHGMVYSQEACVSGRDALKRKYLNIALKNETGVLDEDYVKVALNDDYYSDITDDMKNQWKDQTGKTVKQSMSDYLVEYMGKPMNQLLRYLEHEHYRFCVPSNFSSGFASLPLAHVWVDGVENTSWPTNTTLSTGDKLDGKKAYAMILPYFTTNDMTPKQVQDVGREQLDKLYPLAVEAAKGDTGETNETEAIKQFRKKLDSSDNYFNDEAFPENESDSKAHELCSSIDAAKKYCPTRWKAIQSWFKEARMVMSMLYPKITDMFHFAGDKHSTPNCPVELRPDLNPSSGIQSYDGSDPMCLKPAHYNIPFFLAKLGPKFSEWSINSHEARPGHHIQIQGTREHFRDTCGGLIGWLDSKTYYTAFLEGWGLYAENPLISDDTDVYDGEPMKKYGMLKWQIWRAVRLIVDTGLHYTGMKRDEAIKMFADNAWDDSDFTRKEVTRYQSWPGQSTAYMIGRIAILKARNHSSTSLGKDFNLKDFHYQVLSQGSSPLAFLQEHIENYVECVKDPDKEGCSFILNPPKRAPVKSDDKESGKQQNFEANRHYA